MLKDKILNRQPGIMTYGISPPKSTYVPEKIKEISQKQIDRLKDVEIDGLIVYDVQDEADRTDEERPFPYLTTLDPTLYSEQYLGHWDVPKIIYRCIGGNTEEELSDWLLRDRDSNRYSVFVGASSGKQQVNLQLPQAYELRRQLNEKLLLGGVVIPERHQKKNDEHLRIAEKVTSGCSFFISQATYNIEASKNMLSDYYYHSLAQEEPMVPVLFNLAPCGSQKTLEFMKWLGISIPKWLENDLRNCEDILDKSIGLSLKIFEELFEFGLEKGIPIGCSIESVSTRKVEIEASVQLAKDIKKLIGRRLPVQV